MQLKYTLIVVLLFFTSLSLKAQIALQNYANSLESFRTESASNMNLRTYSQLGDYTGSPFAFENFEQAIIYTKAGDNKGVKYFNFDAYSNRFVISEGNGVTQNDFLWLNNAQIDKVIVELDGGAKLKILTLEPSVRFKNEASIIELLYGEEGIRFVRKYDKKYNPPRESNSGYTSSNASKARFRSNEEVYFIEVTKDPVYLKNDKAFAKLFGDQEKDVRKFMKKEKLDFDNPQHLPIIMANFPLIADKE